MDAYKERLEKFLTSLRLNGKPVPTAWIGVENFIPGIISPVGRIKYVVDLGVDYGYSLFCLAYYCRYATVIGVDSWTYGNSEESKKHVKDNLVHHPNVRLIEKTTVDALEDAKAIIGDDQLDVVHIDASHEYEDVKRDFENWSKLLKPGGCIIFHDTTSHPNDVGRFFRELKGSKFNIESHHGIGVWYNR